MKIAIIGAGAVGVATAHALSKSGCKVQVFEQASSAAQGASFAHSGVYGAGSVQPFFSPAFARHWGLSLLGRPKAIHWARLSGVGDYWLAFKAAWQARRSQYQTTLMQLQSLAQYSVSVGARYLSGKPMVYEQGTGVMVLHTQQAAFEAASLQAKALNSETVVSHKKNKILSVSDAIASEPALAQQSGLIGAIVYPSEGYGNCALFTKQLKLRHQKKDMQYCFNTQVTRLEANGERWQLHTQSRPGTLEMQDPSEMPDALAHNELFDAVIVAAGAASTALLTPLGLRFPVLNTHAYCVTLPIQERIDAPCGSVQDAATGSTLTPIGNRIRISGQYQLGALTKQSKTAYQRLERAIDRWFPFAIKVSQASYDVSSSCVASDSKPLVGSTGLPGLYVNFAHGPNHWALAFGCAQALTDELLGEADKFDLKPFSPQRFI